jgi:hypothetical protein
VQGVPLVRDLPLADARLVRRVAEVDLMVEVATLRRHVRLLGLQAGQLCAELVDVVRVHDACIG